jgi:hypothetical protein
MKKLVVLSLAVLLALPAFAGSATAAKKKAKPIVVEGSVALPQPYAADGTCFYRSQRAWMGLSGGAAPNGVFGYTFDVDPKTVGKKFTLEVSDGAGMDVVFYADMGDPTDPTVAPANTGYETPGVGGEKGTVPKGYPIAFVCMTEGSNAGFTYTAGL